MNISVVLFFASNVLAAVLLGGKFVSKKDPVFKYFGIGLLFDAVAFAFWTIGYVNSGLLLNCVTFGAIALLISLVFFLYASLQNHSASGRTLGIVLGAIAVIGIFLVGRYSPNLAYISPTDRPRRFKVWVTVFRTSTIRFYRTICWRHHAYNEQRCSGSIYNRLGYRRRIFCSLGNATLQPQGMVEHKLD